MFPIKTVNYVSDLVVYEKTGSCVMEALERKLSGITIGLADAREQRVCVLTWNGIGSQ